MLHRVYLVTGAASGIGRATAAHLAGPGVGLMLHTRANQAGLDAVAALATSKGARVVTSLGDLADDGEAGKAVGLAEAAFGRLDAVVSVAGAARRGAMMTLADSELRRAMDDSVFAFTGLVRAAHPLLKVSSDPRIAAVSSFVAHVLRTDLDPFAATAASRAALEAVVRLMARELAGDGITVNAVAPGLIRKDDGRGSKLAPEAIARMEAMIPLGRRGRPEEVAAVLAFLVSLASSYVTGQIIHVNGGLA